MTEGRLRFKISIKKKTGQDAFWKFGSPENIWMRERYGCLDIAEQSRLEAAKGSTTPWRKWGHTSANASGVHCARTTAPTEMLGITSPTIRLVHAPIDGVRTTIQNW